MLFIKAVVVGSGKVQYFNLDKILTISKYDNGNTKILMGAGLYWEVYSNSIEQVNIIDILQNN